MWEETMRCRKIVALHSIHDFDRLLYYTEGYNPHGIKVESIEVTYGALEDSREFLSESLLDMF